MAAPPSLTPSPDETNKLGLRMKNGVVLFPRMIPPSELPPGVSLAPSSDGCALELPKGWHYDFRDWKIHESYNPRSQATIRVFTATITVFDRWFRPRLRIDDRSRAHPARASIEVLPRFDHALCGILCSTITEAGLVIATFDEKPGWSGKTRAHQELQRQFPDFANPLAYW